MIVLLPYIHSIHKRQRRGLQFKITYVTVSKQSLGIAGEGFTTTHEIYQDIGINKKPHTSYLTCARAPLASSFEGTIFPP